MKPSSTAPALTGVAFCRLVADMIATNNGEDAILTINRLICEARGVIEGKNEFVSMVARLSPSDNEEDSIATVNRLIGESRALLEACSNSIGDARHLDEACNRFDEAIAVLASAIISLNPCASDLALVAARIGIDGPSDSDGLFLALKARFHRADDYFESLVVAIEILCGEHNATHTLYWVERESMDFSRETAIESSDIPAPAVAAVSPGRGRMNLGLLSLASWCQVRASGNHDIETTLTMLERKAQELRDAVGRANSRAAVLSEAVNDSSANADQGNYELAKLLLINALFEFNPTPAELLPAATRLKVDAPTSLTNFMQLIRARYHREDSFMTVLQVTIGYLSPGLFAHDPMDGMHPDHNPDLM